MSVDWDTLVHGPVMQAFGEPTPVTYMPVAGPSFPIDGVFDEGASPVRLVDDPEVNEVSPILGVLLSQFPPGYDPRNAKGDRFIARGIVYVVKDGRPDSHGWAFLRATRQ